MEKREMEVLPDMRIPILDEDGKEVDCEVLAIFPVEERQYIVLAPEGREETWIYRFEPVGEEEFNLVDIEDDSEFEKAAEAFDALYEDAEYESALEDE